MTRKENLIFEMENLHTTLCKYLDVLQSEEINDVAYLEINDGCGSVLLALRWYFGEEPYSNRKITIIKPDGEIVEFIEEDDSDI